ncbi:MAG: hypothetical protein OXB84_01005 [Halobacteriovoraceae bacterium]|nr:hypothetical protein [Halobacteriovoraceae bacterium]
MKFLSINLFMCFLTSFLVNAQDIVEDVPQNADSTVNKCYAAGGVRLFEKVVKEVIENSLSKNFICVKDDEANEFLDEGKERWYCGVDYHPDGILLAEEANLTHEVNNHTHTLPRRYDDETQRFDSIYAIYKDYNNDSDCSVTIEYANGDEIIYQLDDFSLPESALWFKNYHPLSLSMSYLYFSYNPDEGGVLLNEINDLDAPQQMGE